MGNTEYILITGGTGFVGHHLIKKLSSKGYSIIALVRRSSNIQKINSYGIHIRYVEDGLQNLFKEHVIVGIIHLATSYGQNQSITSVLESNLMFPLKLIEEGKKEGIKFFINTDSFFTKAKGEYQYLNHYTKSKQLVVDFLKNFSQDIIVINCKLEHVYGENDGSSKFVTNIIRRLKNNELQIDLTEGTQKRDFIYIDDVTEAYCKIIENIEVFNGFLEIELGTGKSTSIKEFVSILHKLTGATSNLNFGALPTRPGEFVESMANSTILNRLGWEPEFTLENGLRKTIENEI